MWIYWHSLQGTLIIIMFISRKFVRKCCRDDTENRKTNFSLYLKIWAALHITKGSVPIVKICSRALIKKEIPFVGDSPFNLVSSMLWGTLVDVNSFIQHTRSYGTDCCVLHTLVGLCVLSMTLHKAHNVTVLTAHCCKLYKYPHQYSSHFYRTLTIRWTVNHISVPFENRSEYHSIEFEF